MDALNHFSIDFSISFTHPVIINFSLALVNATYNILISSDKVSNLIFFLIASLANVPRLSLFSKSIKSGPKPNS